MTAKKQSESANFKMLEFIATNLGSVCDEMVFLGGCTTALFITDSASMDVRYTQDIDCIVDVTSLEQYQNLQEKLIKQGFKQATYEKVMSHWIYDNATLAILPTDEKILGLGNRWYKPALEHAARYSLNNDLSIKHVTAPYYLAIKIEAFKAGGMDYLDSPDFEDIIMVLDGRNEIVIEIEQADNELKNYLRCSFSDMLENREFRGALPGHFIEQGRLADHKVGLLLGKIEQILQ